MKFNKTLATIATVGALALAGCGPKRVTTYSIEQRGQSPMRPVELIKREYFFSNKDSKPGMDYVFVFQDVVQRAEPERSWNLAASGLGSEHCSMQGDFVNDLFVKVKGAEKGTDAVMSEWDKTYNWKLRK